MEIVTFDQIIQNVVLELENDVDDVVSAPPKKQEKQDQEENNCTHLNVFHLLHLYLQKLLMS